MNACTNQTDSDVVRYIYIWVYCILLDVVKEGSPENDELERLANQIINEWKKLGRRLLESTEELLDKVDKDNGESS